MQKIKNNNAVEKYLPMRISFLNIQREVFQGTILDIHAALFRAFLIYFRSATLSRRGSRGRAPIPERVGRLPAQVKPSTAREGRRERMPHLETRCKQPRVNLEREKEWLNSAY